MLTYRQFNADETPFMYQFEAPLPEGDLRRLRTALHLDPIDRRLFWHRPELQQDQGTLRAFYEKLRIQPPKRMVPFLDRHFYFFRPGTLCLIEEV